MVEISGLRILFTGDLGEEGEQELLKAGTDLRGGCSEGGTPRFPFLHRGRLSGGSFSGICCDLLCRGTTGMDTRHRKRSKGWNGQAAVSSIP